MAICSDFHLAPETLSPMYLAHMYIQSHIGRGKEGEERERERERERKRGRGKGEKGHTKMCDAKPPLNGVATDAPDPWRKGVAICSDFHLAPGTFEPSPTTTS